MNDITKVEDIKPEPMNSCSVCGVAISVFSIPFCSQCFNKIPQLEKVEVRETDVSGQDGWISVKERLPENTKEVLGTDGRGYFTVQYTKGHELEVYTEDEEFFDIDVENETFYLKPGWYELVGTPQGTYDETYLVRNIIKWQNLPPINP